MLVLGMNLIVKNLDDVSDRDDPHELRIAQDGDLGDVAFAHLAHDIVDVVIEVAGHGVAGHQVGDAQAAEALAPAVNDAQNVAFAEHPDQMTAVVDHGQRADVVLHELGDRFADGRIGIDGDDAATLGLEDISDKHEAPPRYGACERSQRLESPPTDALDLRKGSVTLSHRDIIFPAMQIIFSLMRQAFALDITSVVVVSCGAGGGERMEPANRGLDEPGLLRGFWGLVLLATFLIRALHAGQPIVENYVGRQVPTAMVARNLDRGSGLLRPQLDTAPFPNYFLVEPPIYESGVVVLKRATGLSLEEAGRILSALATALAALGLFALARPREGALAAYLAVAAFAVFPLTIRYGRAFQPDAAMLGAVVLGPGLLGSVSIQPALVLARGRLVCWSHSVSRSRSPPRFCSCPSCW